MRTAQYLNKLLNSDRVPTFLHIGGPLGDR